MGVSIHGECMQCHQTRPLSLEEICEKCLIESMNQKRSDDILDKIINLFSPLMDGFGKCLNYSEFKYTPKSKIARAFQLILGPISFPFILTAFVIGVVSIFCLVIPIAIWLVFLAAIRYIKEGKF